MLSDFFRINLPYGIAKNEYGEWMAFNREYMPLGYNSETHKGLPGISYLDKPVYTKYEKVTEKFLMGLADDENHLEKDDSGNIVKVFLYSDGTNPVNHSRTIQNLWNNYFAKLQKLSKLKIGYYKEEELLNRNSLVGGES